MTVHGEMIVLTKYAVKLLGPMLIALGMSQIAYPASPSPDGQALYRRYCALCHDMAVGGAPKLGDKVNWAARFRAGPDAMVAAVVKGKGTMPPRAGTKLTDAEIRLVVDYMAVVTK